jgi:serralysin
MNMAEFTITGLSTTAQLLGLGQSGEVLLNGSLVTANVALNMSGNDATFINRGTVISHNNDAIVVSADRATVVNSGFISAGFAVVYDNSTAQGSFTVINSGTIAASSVEAEGVYTNSGGLMLVNSGSITTIRDAAVRAFAGDVDEANTIINSGLIANSGGYSFLMSLDADSITNTGTIIGDIQLGSGANVLRNSGSIEGDVTAGTGVDVIDLRGGFVSGLVNAGGGADVLTGGAEDDRLVGDAGADRITAGAGDDAMSGGNDSDILFGGAGADVLAGGAGVDKLTGGAGADMFDFNTVSTSVTGARDTITDFLRGADDVDLSTIDARASVGGDQAFTFIGSAAFSGQGQLRIIDLGNDVVVQANRSGSLVADFELLLQNVGTLTATDFIL